MNFGYNFLDPCNHVVKLVILPDDNLVVAHSTPAYIEALCTIIIIIIITNNKIKRIRNENVTRGLNIVRRTRNSLLIY